MIPQSSMGHVLRALRLAIPRAALASLTVAVVEGLFVWGRSPLAAANPARAGGMIAVCAAAAFPVSLLWAGVFGIFGAEVRKRLPHPLLLCAALVSAVAATSAIAATYSLAMTDRIEFEGPVSVIVMGATFVTVLAATSVVAWLVAVRERFVSGAGRASVWVAAASALAMSATAVAVVHLGFDRVRKDTFALPGLVLSTGFAALGVSLIYEFRLRARTTVVLALVMVAMLIPMTDSTTRFLFFSRSATTAASWATVARWIKLNGDGVGGGWRAGVEGGTELAQMGSGEERTASPPGPQPVEGRDFGPWTECVGRFREQVPRPNVVLLTFDALRADTFSRYAPDYLEPILRRSAWFTRAYAASSMTNYAVPSMFSGQYVGAMAAGQDMSAREPLRLYLALPAALRRDGYRVEALTLLDVGVFAAAFDSMSGGDADPPPRGGEKFGFYAGALTRTAIRRLLNPPDAPLMLWVHHADTHAPYTPIDRNVFPEPDASDYERAAAYSLFRSAPLMDVILRSQRQDDTVLVISSDHGEELGERGRLGHGSDLVETALRVPLVLHVPGCPAGTYDQAVSLIELAPTLAYLTGVGSVRWSLLDRLGGKTSPVSIGAEVYTGARSEHAIVTQEAKLRVDVRSGGRTHTDLQQGSGDDAIVSGETAMSLDESYARWLASVSLWRP